MRFEHTLRYDASPDEIFAMLGEAVFREKVCEAQHVTECTATVDGVDGTMSVMVDQKRPSEGIPSFAKKFVGDTIHIKQREEWSSPTDAVLDVTIPGKPGHMKGTITLRQEGDGTVETVSGELKVGIPLVGGKIEVLIAELFEHALQAEHRVGTAWLAQR
ncbi:MAG TPA: DUF2505 domain-containing protein [Nocardioidaceae bacterium]|nr:DUF2505 domain-containing protein [Nocardioidaceae bacterium]